MTPDDRSSEQPLADLDALRPDQARRYQLWRAMADLSRAHEHGQLSPEQVRLLGSLAESLQRLSAQLTQLAELGQQAVQLLAPDRADARPAAGQRPTLATDAADA
jgi:hypothetical protein